MNFGSKQLTLTLGLAAVAAAAAWGFTLRDARHKGAAWAATATGLHERIETAGAELRRISEQRDSLREDLHRTDQHLREARSRSVSLEARLEHAGRDLAAARAELERAQERERGLRGEITGLKRELILAAAAAEFPAEPKPSEQAVSVLEVGPQSAFVVLDAGREHGLSEDGKVRILREGLTVAEGVISRVEARLAVARIRGSSLRTPLHPGDFAHIGF